MSAHGQVWVTASLALLPGAFALVVFWMTQVSPVARHLLSYQGLAGPFFVPFAVLFGLFAAFLANDIWVRAQDRSDELEQSFERESSALRSLQRVAMSLKNSDTGLQSALIEYTEKTGGNGRTVLGQHDTDAANDGLQKVVDEILSPRLSWPSCGAARNEMLSLANTIERSRAERATSTSYESDALKWIGMVALGFLTQVAIAIVHIENRRAQAAGLTLFSLAFSVVLVIIAASEQSASTSTGRYPLVLTEMAR